MLVVASEVDCLKYFWSENSINKVCCVYFGMINSWNLFGRMNSEGVLLIMELMEFNGKVHDHEEDLSEVFKRGSSFVNWLELHGTLGCKLGFLWLRVSVGFSITRVILGELRSEKNLEELEEILGRSWGGKKILEESMEILSRFSGDSKGILGRP